MGQIYLLYYGIYIIDYGHNIKIAIKFSETPFNQNNFFFFYSELVICITV